MKLPKLLFDKTSHSYYLIKDGKQIEVPSVTTILGVIDKSAPLIIWATRCMSDYILQSETMRPDNDGMIVVTKEGLKSLLDRAKIDYRSVKTDAADVGTQVHNYIEDFIHGKNPAPPSDERAHRCAQMFIDWIKGHEVKFLLSEQKLYSTKHNFCGTMDWLAEVTPCGDRTCCPFLIRSKVLGDIKTSKRIYDEYGLQLAAYKEAYEEISGDKVDARCIIRVGKDAEEIEVRYFTNQEMDFNTFLAAYTIYSARKNKFYKHYFEKKERIRR